MNIKSISTLALSAIGITAAVSALAGTGSITVKVNEQGHKIPSSLYGIFLEEISHAGEGGLYAELIQNRGFEDSQLPAGCTLEGDKLIPPRTPHYWVQPRVSDWTMPWPNRGQWPGWSLLTDNGSVAELALTDAKPLNKATPHSLQIKISSLGTSGRVAVANEGFWGISVKEGESYNLKLHARGEAFKGTLTAALESKDGKVLAANQFKGTPGAKWKEYNCAFKATGSDPKARLVISFGSTGNAYLDWVSLMPAKVFRDKPYNLRPDIAQYIADLKPAFIRWPGGCYVEGLSVESCPNWKTTLGPLEERPGTYSPWGYWNTDGFGYHEWLQFCEDINSDALYVVNVGVSCAFRSGTFIPDEKVPGLIKDTLDSIEYAIGPKTSKWGAVRAKNGHPEPFPLKYIEIGNEQQGPRYGARWALFYKAIKEKYPNLPVALSSWIAGIDRGAIGAAGKIDILDEHAYKGVNWALENWDYFDNYKRGDWDLYIGEFACNGGVDRGNLLAALNDSVFMMMMEKNSDLVKMGSYAPLLENVDAPSNWAVNLIHFDSSRIFGRASYYACKLFAENQPDVNLKTEVTFKPSMVKEIGGGVGLGTFNTTAEYKDVKVEKDGNVLYQSDFAKGTDGWRKEGDTWEVIDGALRQKKNVVSFAFLENKEWTNTTISCKARKLDGGEGFIILAGYDDGRRVCWNIGGWGNSQHVIQVDGSIIGKAVKSQLENNRWYDIKVQIEGRIVRCFLDGEMVNEAPIPRLDNIYSIAGRDGEAGEVVIKVVNPGPEAASMDINLVGAYNIANNGDLITLTSKSFKDENSFEEPFKITPQASKISGLGKTFNREFPPYSLSIIRIREGALTNPPASNMF